MEKLKRGSSSCSSCSSCPQNEYFQANNAKKRVCNIYKCSPDKSASSVTQTNKSRVLNNPNANKRMCKINGGTPNCNNNTRNMKVVYESSCPRPPSLNTSFVYFVIRFSVHFAAAYDLAPGGLPDLEYHGITDFKAGTNLLCPSLAKLGII